jgi:quercetin dioxygenase-like cupin family protein
LTLGLVPFGSLGGELELENLLKAELEGVAKTEVIVSKVKIPPNTSLPKHWHPGEEFAYVLDGTATLWQKGKPDIVIKQGGVAKIPLKQVHTAISGPEGVNLLIFRVHEQGKPERIAAE